MSQNAVSMDGSPRTSITRSEGSGTLAFEGRMEQETPGANDKITTVGDEENLVMLMPATAQNSLDPEPHKQQVGQCIDDLGGVDGRIVVLS